MQIQQKIQLEIQTQIRIKIQNTKYKRAAVTRRMWQGWRANKQSRPPGGLWRHWDNCCPVPSPNSTLPVFSSTVPSRCKLVHKDQLDFSVLWSDCAQCNMHRCSILSVLYALENTVCYGDTRVGWWGRTRTVISRSPVSWHISHQPWEHHWLLAPAILSPEFWQIWQKLCQN